MAVHWQAEAAPDPRLLVLNERLAADLGLDAAWLATPAGVRFLAGNLVPDGATPVAQAYAGHQFGGFVPRLGDGRALLLGEIASGGTVRDLHLKGSGATALARSAPCCANTSSASRCMRWASPPPGPWRWWARGARSSEKPRFPERC